MIEFLFGPEWLVFSIAPLVGAALIGAGAGGLQALGAGAANRASRRFQERMFHMTNKYNSPLEQMKRLQKAGLNPNLVYGGSPGGTAGTANQPAKPDFNIPDYQGIVKTAGEGLMSYLNTKSVQSTVDVNEERAQNIKQDTINKGIDAVNKAIQSASGSLDYKTKHRLYENTVKTAEERLRNLSVQTEYTSGKNQRENRIIDETENKLRIDIENAKKQGKILSEDAIMKRIDRELYDRYNVRPQDPHYYRILTKVFEGLMDSMGLDKFKDKFKR